MNCRDELCGNLDNFEKRTLVIVNNLMTNGQQRATKRIVDKRKKKLMRLKMDSRGRMMKYQQRLNL